MRETGNFSFVIDASTNDQIQQIWSVVPVLNNLLTAADYRERFAVNVVLESIRLDVYIPSFDKAGFPEIFPEMNAAEKSVELMKIESKYPKCGLAFYRRPNTGGPWIYLSEIVLQNRGRRAQIPVIVPYFTTGEIKLLNRDAVIGVQKVNYGNGVIGNGPIEVNRLFDKVQIEADFRIDIDKIEYKRSVRMYTQETAIIQQVPFRILHDNFSRAAWEIQNQSNNIIYFIFDSRYSDMSSGAFIIQPGQTAFSSMNPYCEVEEIWAKASGPNSRIAFKEWIYE